MRLPSHPWWLPLLRLQLGLTGGMSLNSPHHGNSTIAEFPMGAISPPTSRTMPSVECVPARARSSTTAADGTLPRPRWSFQAPLTPRLDPRYHRVMDLTQCKAIVLYGRDYKGNRKGLIPPRRCQRPATQGDYCGIHARQAELQDLLRSCLSYDWERKVRAHEERDHKRRLERGRQVARGMEEASRELGLTELGMYLLMNRTELADLWASSPQ